MSTHPCLEPHLRKHVHPASDSAESVFLTEIFSAIQGEGHYVGHRQVFLRLTGCNLRCCYCDQPESLELRGGTCRVECVPGAREWKTCESPVPVVDAAAWVDDLMRAIPHHSVSVTGGEPLMQSGRLTSLLPDIRSRGHRIHLETSGVLYRGLARVVEWVDAISMDIKLNSADRQGIDLEVHERFLEVAAGAANRPNVYAKAVLAETTTVDEVVSAVSMVHDVDPHIEVYLQPVTPFGSSGQPPSPSQLLALHEAALRISPTVRVLPQTHKIIGQL